MIGGESFTPGPFVGLSILALGFQNALFGWFLALAVIPIIIYLINRQRYRRVRWAAMEFLLRAMQKNRRRLRMENLLLLIIRTLIVLFFVFGMMRPLLESSVMSALSGNSRAELTILDRSYSMGLKEGSLPLLSVAVTAATERIQEMRDGDRVGLILGGGAPEVVLTQPQPISHGDNGTVAEVIDQLENVELIHESFDVAFTLATSADWIQKNGGEGGWSIHLYTDLQNRDWKDAENPNTAIADSLRRLEAAKVPVVVHPVGAEKPRNASVTDLSCRDFLAALDLATAFQVTVANRSSEPMAGLDVELWVDGSVQGSRRVSLDPGATSVVSFPYVFRRSGQARLRAVLLSDALQQDNVRHAVMEVRESVDVLVADGGYTSAGEAEEAAWLEAALGMGPSNLTGVRLTPYDTRIVPSDRLHATTLAGVDILILANVGTLTVTDCDHIEEFLERGGGVLVFAGNRISIADYTDKAHRGGEGWFPYAPLRTVEDLERNTFFHWNIVRADHPVMKYLAETPEAGMGEVMVHGFVRPRPGLDEASVLIVLDDYEKTPMLVERNFGDGTVLVLNTSADRAWSNFPISPAYLCFLHESLPYLVSRSDVPRNLSISEPFRRVIPSQELATRLAARSEGGDTRVMLITPQGDAVPLVLNRRGEENTFELTAPGQSRPGNYEIRYGGGAVEDEAQSEWFAVNSNPDEGILARIPGEEIESTYPGKYLEVEHQGRRELRSAVLPPQQTGEIWRSLFWAVLLLLTAESILGRYFGRKRVRIE